MKKNVTKLLNDIWADGTDHYDPDINVSFNEYSLLSHILQFNVFVLKIEYHSSFEEKL